MTATEAKRLFTECQNEHARIIGELARLKAEKALIDVRKGELYRQYTDAQAKERERKADQRAQQYQTKRGDIGGPVEIAPETPEERMERIINEQHEKNLQLEREGKW